MAKRYSRLPSEIMTDATTFDMVIMDAALSYEQRMMDKELEKAKGIKRSAEPMPVTDEKMLAAFKKFKEQNGQSYDNS